MKIEDFISQDYLKYPYSYTGGFKEQLFLKLERFQKEIKNVDLDCLGIDTTDVSARSNEIVNGFKKAINDYLDGYVVDSFREISRIMKKNEKYLLVDMFKTSIYPINTGLYKVRPIRKNKMKLSCKDLYHVPLDEYYKNSSYRFSILGHTCLYLGSSIDLCIQEVPKKHDEKYAISRYELWQDGSLSTIFLAYRTKDIIHLLSDAKCSDEMKRDTITNYLIFLPILISCYGKVERSEYSFKPEYIISQAIMHYVRTKIKGNVCVCYLSTKDQKNNFDKPFHLNFAFPLPSSSNLSEWHSLFYLTKPIILNKLQIAFLTQKYKKKICELIDLYGRKMDTIISIKNAKWKTYTGKLEKLLQHAKNYNYNHKDFSKEKKITDYEYEDKNSWI